MLISYQFTESVRKITSTSMRAVTVLLSCMQLSPELTKDELYNIIILKPIFKGKYRSIPERVPGTLRPGN